MAIVFEIDDVIRETGDRHCSHWQVDRHARHRDPERGKSRIRSIVFIHGIEELTPRFQIERRDSPCSKFSFGASSNVFPRHAGRLASHYSPGSPLNFSGPCGLDFSGILRFGIIQTCEEFCRHISTLGNGQSQGFAKNFLRSRIHEAILHLGKAANIALEASAPNRSSAPQLIASR